MINFLKGKKTYVVGGLLVLAGLVQVIIGDLNIMEFLQSPALLEILSGFGFGALRSGVKKEG